jgi:hypothetical protein
MSWHLYNLDHLAVEIVLMAKKRDETDGTDSSNQAHKMRAACAYGLERFWGESRRLAKDGSSKDDLNKARFIGDVWKGLAGVIAQAGIVIPCERNIQEGVASEESAILNQLWSLTRYEQSVALAVLTNLCDSIVWWTQRLMKANQEMED